MGASNAVGHGDARREVRLALVMNGGVSLAVWMGGVTHEFDLLRNASAPPRAEGVDTDEVQQIWREVLAAAGERVTIDVVSGTSAGGLNGVLLATAIARGRALPPLREVWKESASLTRLLEGASTSSILNGETFRAEIANAVERIDRSERREANAVELLVTATALGGAGFPFKDSFSNAFEVQDHRRLYQFRHGLGWTYDRGGSEWVFKQVQQKDFAAEFTDLLVLAARASASYPAAFPPVDSEPLKDLQLRRQPLTESDASCVMDGGVLNNAPFEPVLAAITSRGIAFSPIRRVLVYVVPSTGLATASPGDPTTCSDIPIYKPPMSALQYPMEANLRSSVEEMLTRLRGRAQDMPTDLLARMWQETYESVASRKWLRRRRKPAPLAKHLSKAAHGLLGEYRRNRAYAGVLDARRRLADGRTEITFATPRDGTIDECAGVLLQAEGLAWLPRWEPSELDGQWTTWRWGLAATERLLQCLSVHLRHLADHNPSSKERLPEEAQTSLISGDREVTEVLRQVLAMMETADADLQSRVDAMEQPVSIEALASAIHQTYTDLHMPAELLGLVQEASGAYVNAISNAGLSNGWTAETVMASCLAVEVVTRVYATPAKILTPLPPEFSFLRLSPDNMSPLIRDPDLAGLGDKKLYGLRLGHFGAFVDPDWRQSDFTWGRLDAVNHLLSLFQLPSVEQQEFKRRLHLAILKDEAPRNDADVPPSEEVAINWLESHLSQAQKTDSEILGDVVETDAGKQLLRDLSGALVRIIDSTLPPDTAGGGMKVPWRKAVQVGRIAFAPHSPVRGPLAWVLRPLTIWPRRRAYRALSRDPRDLHPQVLYAFVGNVGCAVLVLIGLAVLATWLASRR
ncbi:DUF3376 domain-containing protein [Streptomyces chartreusis]|uniref:DUF3376 domain-containing protein n=1 Tax=Streptomyces chartreusis TaxID=1969 RepID=UPI0036C3C7E5